MTDSHAFTRRDFTLLAAGGALAAAAAHGQAPDHTSGAEASVAVDRLLALVLAQYPGRALNDVEQADIRAELEAQLERGRALGGVKLSNADGPGFAFRAWRAP